MKTKLLSVFLVLAMLFSMAACGSTGNAPAGNETKGEEKGGKDTLVVGIDGDPGSVNPYDALSGSGRKLYTPVYEALFAFDETGLAQPKLCESYTFDEDGKGITMKVHEGVKFHNGEEMTSEDVVYSINLLLNSAHSGNLGDVNAEGVKAVDKYTVYVPYNSVAGAVLNCMTSVYVLNKKHMEEVGDKASLDCIGTGKFKWGKITSGMEYQMDRFDDYWGGPADLKQITIRIINDASVAIMELQTGGIDMYSLPNAADVNKVKKGESGYENLSTFQASAISTFCLYFNCGEESVFHDANVRKAVCYALNAQEFVDMVYEGNGSVAKYIVGKAAPCYKEYTDDEMIKYNEAKAKECLAAAGYADGLEVDLHINSSHTKSAEILLNQLSKVGINVNVKTLEKAALTDLQKKTNEVKMTFTTWNCSGEPTTLLNTVYNPALSQLGKTTYMLRTYDEPDAPLYAELLEKANTELDNPARMKAYQDLFDLIYNNNWIFPIVSPEVNWIVNKNLKGFWTGATSYHYEDIYFAQ